MPGITASYAARGISQHIRIYDANIALLTCFLWIAGTKQSQSKDTIHSIRTIAATSSSIADMRQGASTSTVAVDPTTPTTCPAAQQPAAAPHVAITQASTAPEHAVSLDISVAEDGCVRLAILPAALLSVALSVNDDDTVPLAITNIATGTNIATSANITHEPATNTNTDIACEPVPRQAGQQGPGDSAGPAAGRRQQGPPAGAPGAQDHRRGPRGAHGLG